MEVEHYANNMVFWQPISPASLFEVAMRVGAIVE